MKIYWVDTRRSGRNFKRDLKLWKGREKKISPFEVEVGGFRVHVTPLENPKYERSSFHIIRLWDSKDSQYQVDFLIQDTDLYFVAFRRKANRQWEGWFTFKDTDKKVDNFLGATTKIKMKLRYPDDKYVLLLVAFNFVYYRLLNPTIFTASFCISMRVCSNIKL